MALAVNERSDEIKALAADWPMLEALTTGTREMRAAGTAFLPKWPAETDEAYAARLATATLFPAYRRTVNVMSGKPFSKAVSLTDAPPSIDQWAEDIDLQGCSLHVFAAEMFAEAVGFGLCGVLVEAPQTVAPSRSLAERPAGLRPYWVRVRHDQVLGWKAASVGGAMKLTQLRLLETYEEPDGRFGVKVKPQVRVLEPGRWEVWRQTADKGKTWELAEEGATTLDEVPFVPFYGQRVGFMQGKAPLLDLAFLNVKHWQSQSDQDTILHVARVPILTARDVGDDFQLQVGASSAVNLGDGQNAELKYVEHSGGAIEAGDNSLIKLRDQMIETGAELLVRRQSGQVSATEAGNDAEANKSDLQRIAENFEDSLDQALWLTAKYARLPEGGSVELFDDYGAATLSDASAQLIRDLQQSGVISKETAIAELKRRGVLAETVDAAEEADRVSSEGPALGTLGLDEAPEAA